MHKMGVYSLWRFVCFLVAGVYFLFVDRMYDLLHTIEMYIPGSSEVNIGKWAIVTGANTGVGLETCKGLVRDGVNVIAACRSRERGTKAVDIIQKGSKNGAQCHLILLDLSSFHSIRNFIEEFKKLNVRLNIIVNNAGIMATPFHLTEDGLEAQIGVNHFGHFLLTYLLLDSIDMSGDSRIILLSSCVHELGSIDESTFHSDRNYSPGDAYAQSKLANMLAAFEFQRRLDVKYGWCDEGENMRKVVVNAIHPGVVASEIARGLPHFLPRMMSLAKVLMKDTAQGARTSIHCALSPDLRGVGGKYFSDCKVKSSAQLSKSVQLAKSLFDTSVHIVGLREDDCKTLPPS